MDVRAAVPGDLEPLRAVYREASLSNEGDREVLLAHPDVLLWAPDSVVPTRTRVAVDGEQVVGFATTSESGEGLELDDLFVDPARMRQGVASLLIAAIADEARREGRRWIEVTGNLHAAAFYASAGFAVMGEVATTFGPAPRLRLVL